MSERGDEGRTGEVFVDLLLPANQALALLHGGPHLNGLGGLRRLPLVRLLLGPHAHDVAAQLVVVGGGAA